VSLATSASAQPSSDSPRDASDEETDANRFEEALRFAENAYVYGDYIEVVQALRPRLLPAGPEDVDLGTLVRAYTLLGTSAQFCEMGDVADASFLEILLRDPRFRLDPLLYPPLVIARFDAVREANEERLQDLLVEQDAGATVYLEREVRSQSRLVSMMPFGYGFFASDRDVAGMSYAIGEAALGGAMLTLFLANEVARGDDGYFQDPARARARGRAQIAMASGFSALLLANLIHGALTHERTQRVEFRTLTEPPAELDPARRSSHSSSRWRVAFSPL